MIKRTVLLVYVIVFCVLPMQTTPAQPEQRTCSCSVIERALKDAQSVKLGMMRKDVEAHNFVVSGGMVVRDRTAYVYKDCEYIKLEIEFNPDPAVARDFSPKDVITNISKLTLDYPVMD